MRPMPILMIRDEDTAPQVTGGTPAPRPPLAHGGRDLVVRTEPLWHGSGEAHLAHVAVSVRFDRPRRVAVVWDDSDLLVEPLTQRRVPALLLGAILDAAWPEWRTVHRRPIAGPWRLQRSGHHLTVEHLADVRLRDVRRVASAWVSYLGGLVGGVRQADGRAVCTLVEGFADELDGSPEDLGARVWRVPPPGLDRWVGLPDYARALEAAAHSPE